MFLSYFWSDKPPARDLKAGLDAAGCRVWIDEGELRVGDSMLESISAALDQVDFIAVLVSTASVDSNWCPKEVAPVLPTLKDKLYLAVDPANVPAADEALLVSIRKHLDPRDPLPPRRRPSAPRQPTAAPSAARPHGPLHVVGVDRSGITRPHNDVTCGSGLYAVPLMLSGTSDAL